jgi:DNA-binding NarL/FixJ family response regulator
MLARLLHGLQKKDEQGPATPLTKRELEVLRELSLGRDNDAVATALRMSPNTARTHVQNILSKLKVHSKLEAVSRGIREGWIRIPQEPAA